MTTRRTASLLVGVLATAVLAAGGLRSDPAAAATAGGAAAASPDARENRCVRRVAGADRIETAIAASQDNHTGPFRLPVVRVLTLARADDFADALAATPLAGRQGGPLLLTAPGALDPRTEAEVRRVLVPGGTVHLLGGTAALGEAVERRLLALGFALVRHAGADRYETAVRIAEAMGNPSVVYLATGLDWPDALVAGSAAARSGGAVLLTAGAALPPATAAYLAARPPFRRYAVGRPAGAADPQAQLLAGNDRYETAAYATAETTGARIALVSGASGGYADALAAGALLAPWRGQVFFTDPARLPVIVRRYLESHSTTVQGVYVVGGPAAVGPAVEAEARAATNLNENLNCVTSGFVR